MTPRLPAPLRGVNALGRLFGRGRPLDGNRLVERAVEQAGGFDDFGEGDFETPLSLLVEGLERDAGLTLLGRRLARRLLTRYLRSRLEMRRAVLTDPSIASQPIVAPIFIVGLPRTGTTILHHMLAQDPKVASLQQWMLDHPAPIPDADAPDDDPRIRATARQAAIFYRMLPAFRAIHTIGPRLPNECVALKAHAMTTITFPLGYRVPEYGRWLLDADQSTAYELHRRALQHFSHGAPHRDRWVLKSPGHLLALDALFAVYPDAWIVHTHRDPVTVMASLASLSTTLRSLSSDAADPRQVGPEIAGFWSVALERASAFRRSRPELADRFIDVRMADLLGDFEGMVGTIRQRVGLEWNETLRTRAARFLAEHHQGRHGRHTYIAADFGLDPEREAERFAWYRDQQGWTS